MVNKRLLVMIAIILITAAVLIGCSDKKEKGDNSTGNVSAKENKTVQTKTIGRVQENGTTFTIFDSNGKQVTAMSIPSANLIGYCSNFLLIKVGTKFTIYNVEFKQITSLSIPNTDGVGVGNDFIVLKSGTTFTTYDERFKKITSISIGGAASSSVSGDIFTVRVGTSDQRYDKNCKRR